MAPVALYCESLCNAGPALRHRGSQMDVGQMIRSIQRELGIEVDGKAGPQTWNAIHGRIVSHPDRTVAGFSGDGGGTNARSDKVIASLESIVQPYARALYFKAKENRITMNIISGLRTYEEQAALYSQGRTASGAIVTNARPGQSVHNFGLAFDVGVFAGNKYLGDSAEYKAIGALGMELGLEWGGTWKTTVDQAHFQLRPSWAKNLTERQMLTQLRDRRARGDVFV